MNGKSQLEIRCVERRDCNDIRLKFIQSVLQALEIVRFCKKREVDIAAKFRSPVEYAGLTSHEQATDAMFLHRRKDFQCRVRVQESLQVLGTFRAGVLILPSAAVGSVYTNQAIRMEFRNRGNQKNTQGDHGVGKNWLLIFCLFVHQCSLK